MFRFTRHDRARLAETQEARANDSHAEKSNSNPCDIDTRVEESGLILLDRTGEPLYINSAAEKILCYPKAPRNTADGRSKIREKVRSDLWTISTRSGSTALTSGRRRYHCRSLVLQGPPNDAEGPTVAIVMERNSRRNENLRRLFEQYKLTPREREAVLLLTDGLTSKEIAQRMNISTHTVKGFLRMIMVKLGVTTRSGIVGKINTQGRTE